MHINTPAQLIIGSDVSTKNYAEHVCQTMFCTANGCKRCITCNQITQHQFHSLVWITPEKQYTLELLDVIFETTALALQEDQQFFFVLEYAHLLTQACANKLLKIIEEPPRGYHFLLLTQRPEQLLPTIRSRCINHVLYDALSTAAYVSPFNAFFTGQLKPDPYQFMQMLEKSGIQEQLTITILDDLLKYWMEQAKQEFITNISHEHSMLIIQLLEAAYARPPMPGGSKLFWKNLFISFYAIKNSTKR